MEIDFFIVFVGYKFLYYELVDGMGFYVFFIRNIFKLKFGKEGGKVFKYKLIWCFGIIYKVDL